MSDTAYHRAKMHRLATARRARGLPSWAETIDVSDVFHDESKPFEEIRDAVVLRIKASKWYRNSEECGDLRDLVDLIADAENGDEFDHYWSKLYDMADYDRVWVNTMGGPRK